jgi:hypothetical protein
MELIRFILRIGLAIWLFRIVVQIAKGMLNEL